MALTDAQVKALEMLPCDLEKWCEATHNRTRIVLGRYRLFYVSKDLGTWQGPSDSWTAYATGAGHKALETWREAHATDQE